MKRIAFCHALSWRDPETKTLRHIDEHEVTHVLDKNEPCDVMNFLVPDDTIVEVGDWWNGSKENPQFSKEMFLGLGPKVDHEAPDMGRVGFNAVAS